MTTQQIICITIFLVTLVFYMSNKFPHPLVSMTSMVALTLTGCLTPDAALATFSNSSAIIMVITIIQMIGKKYWVRSGE